MSVKLGIAPIAWSNDDMPELGGDTPLEQCLSEASEAGFSGIEFGRKFPKKSDELIPMLEKYNLKLCSGWYGANLRRNSVKEEIDLIQEQLKLFQDCKAPCIVFAEVSDSIAGDQLKPLSTRPKMDSDGWMWMLHGDMGEDNTKPLTLNKEDAAEGQWIESGAHLMLMPKDPATLKGNTTDFNSGAPYIMFEGTGYDHLMIPVEGYFDYQAKK